MYFECDLSTTFVFTRTAQSLVGSLYWGRRKILVACGLHVFRITNKRTTVENSVLNPILPSFWLSPVFASELNDCYCVSARITAKTCLFLICKLRTLLQDFRECFLRGKILNLVFSPFLPKKSTFGLGNGTLQEVVSHRLVKQYLLFERM